MSQYLNNLKVGDDLEISGPVGKCIYHGEGQFEFVRIDQTQVLKNLIFIAGGSGITPLYQILLEFKEESKKNFEIFPAVDVLYYNKTENDILLKKELEALRDERVINNLIFSVDSTENPDWDGYTGILKESHLEKICQNRNIKNTMVFYCGNENMNKHIVEVLDSVGLYKSFKY
jgi:NAD(P)H-flavin reductase